MAGYKPLYVKGYQTGLVQERENFILPSDAYPILENAFVWRERIKRKQGCQFLERLRREISDVIVFGGPPVNLITLFSLQPTSTIAPGTITIIVAGNTYIENNPPDGTLIGTPAGTGTINYTTGVVNISIPGAGTITFNYFPGLPVMGLLQRELDNLNNEEMVAFDTVYAYRFNFGTGFFDEFLPGTVWNGADFQFFWGTNYFVGDGDKRIFWVTNFSGPTGTPIRYTNGSPATNWIDFTPQIDAAGNVLGQSLALLPFRSRLVAFNTWEGGSLAASTAFPQRIRWAAIGTPFTTPSAIVTNVNPNAWRDDIRGQGGFLDIPTSESIVSVGFVRDNLVIYCERSTWQLRYTGRSISPFQIERVNSELGAESTFSAIQFDTSLVGIGDKGIVECDSFKSQRIDIKIPDLVFHFNNTNQGPQRVYGIRDFQQRLAYWVYPVQLDNESDDPFSNIFPNRRLVYNYENDSWAIFTDSYTALGTFQNQNGLTWAQVPDPWQQLNFPWVTRPALFPDIVGGNQQGYVEYLDVKVTNDISLFIEDITGFNLIAPTQIKSPNHNLQNDQIIEIKNIPVGTPFDNLNGGIFSVILIDKDNFQLFIYNPVTDAFDLPQNDAPAVYIGLGEILIRDNFNITSKKFNFLDDGENIQFGYMDILMNTTTLGEITLNIYFDYNDSQPINQFPYNVDVVTNSEDTFFNTIIPTSVQVDRGSTKNWQRIFCPSRGAFITLQFTLSNLQMITAPQESDVQIDTQVLWMRKAGRQLPIGV